MPSQMYIAHILVFLLCSPSETCASVPHIKMFQIFNATEMPTRFILDSAAKLLNHWCIKAY